MDNDKFDRFANYSNVNGQTVININTMNGNIVGVTSGEEKPKAKDFYRDLLVYLDSKRVLFNPSAVEQREHCITSVLEMKHTLTKSIQGKQLTDNELQPIRDMILACNNYLDNVGTVDGSGFIIESQGWEWFNMSPDGALGSMRMKFRSAIDGIEKAYDLKYSNEII